MTVKGAAQQIMDNVAIDNAVSLFTNSCLG